MDCCRIVFALNRGQIEPLLSLMFAAIQTQGKASRIRFKKLVQLGKIRVRACVCVCVCVCPLHVCIVFLQRCDFSNILRFYFFTFCVIDIGIQSLLVIVYENIEFESAQGAVKCITSCMLFNILYTVCCRVMFKKC